MIAMRGIGRNTASGEHGNMVFFGYGFRSGVIIPPIFGVIVGNIVRAICGNIVRDY